MIRVESKGMFEKATKMLQKKIDAPFLQIAEKYAKEGVAALASATPVDTGKTANSWEYDVTQSNGRITITWRNTNIVNGYANVAILLQFGHLTRNHGWVSGYDYINPALNPVVERLKEEIRREVSTK